MTPAAASAGRLAPVSLETLPPYSPTTYVDFSQPADTRRVREGARRRARRRLGKEYPLVIGGERVEGARSRSTSTNPARPSEVLGRSSRRRASRPSRRSRRRSPRSRPGRACRAAERAAYLVEAATRMRERRHQFSAWMVLEVGKSWAEADADTAEAIDFLEFYAREMLRYDQPGAAHPAAGREGHAGLPAARRRRGDPAVELPARDLRRHDDAPRS